ncbi:GNAT family N-acetyltransferase [Bacillus pseudomycoides]|uniref:GNAT family N-acetyltransferase n=1 Tax=Bacillus pseudomycoides TaxID=64104 RepID=A0A2B4MF85_9BACI|nr:GNAT family protein [Bacillus pseudomycoides]PDY44476.1 GNAT family N-acetyltransferase [Bacillus pseudomycoides]PEA82624.1 GNAT family N-acetyltransferase [Bacillus pseudomycoides]PED06009.1 GNAT family N-acetyltransferase [Bacillus pseudomycoides]PED72346.1 GNAT family N-acetyltransferase [Bacillus pseudomycoides]PEI39519.1 GNAT family N-acetyltransferase [Bacillus pseudomycoides]
MNVPIIVLRELSLDDVEDRYQWSLDKEVTKHLVVPDQYPPFTRDETKRWIEMCLNRKNGYEQRAIVTRDGVHIGWVDLKNFDTTNKNAELGIAIGNKEYWGRRYGIAALYSMLQIGFYEFGLEKVWLRVDADNIKAIKSYEKAGFVCEGIMRNDRLREGAFINRYRFSMLKEEYEIINKKVLNI